MSFSITILGCGSAVPLIHRRPTAQFIEIEQRTILMDCGEGTQIQLRKFGVRFQNLDVICISHLHGDHYLGLPGLLQTLHLLGREKKLAIIGPPELEKMLAMHLSMGGSTLRYEIEFTATQAGNKQLVWEDKLIEVYSFPLKHKIPTTGFLFQEKEKPRKLLGDKVNFYGVPHYLRNEIKLGADFQTENGELIPNSKLTTNPPPSYSYAFCSDTAYFPELVDFLPQGINLLYHEGSFLEQDLDKAKQTQHSTAQEAGKMAKLLGVDKLVIGHFSARYKDLEPFQKEAEIHFNNVVLAKDGLVILPTE